MADDRSFARLQAEHFKALNLSRERTEKWERFKGDYEALQARLYTLPDKLTHDIMVPFGRFGFMPGKMYHTNEVMVLLGDNWFAKRTCKQALEIAERRKQYVMEKLEEERKQVEDWEARMGFTEEMRTTRQEHEGVVEIKEALGKEDAAGSTRRKEWRARRPKHQAVPPPRPAFTKHQEKRLGAEVMTKIKSQTSEDEALWNRLDELEKEETEYLEREKMAEGGGGGGGGREREGKDEVVMEKSTEEGAGLRGHEEALTSDSGPLHITVKHSHGVNELINEDEVDTAIESTHQESSEPLFRTPGDIFKRYCNPLTSDDGDNSEEESVKVERRKGEEEEDSRVSGEKSVKWAPVLERHQSPPHVESVAMEGKEEGGASGHTAAAVAFSGQVVEHSAPSEASSVKEEAPKKVSKFKASRKRT